MPFCLAGLGKTTPDPSASITLDGVEVPLGTGISSGVNDTCLLYNEYPFMVMPWELAGDRSALGAMVTVSLDGLAPQLYGGNVSECDLCRS